MLESRSTSPIRGEIDLCRNVIITPSSDRSDQAVRPVHNARTNNQPCNSGAVAKPPEPLDLDNVLYSSRLENLEGRSGNGRVHLQTQCLELEVPTMQES